MQTLDKAPKERLSLPIWQGVTLGVQNAIQNNSGHIETQMSGKNNHI